ncbi:toxic anion resistance protein [Erythrobacter sp. QSSC1-22B]|uniref:toxic anion resistance protein n=1 Tax=Erythrobacter sp. QSSC1-22B TaxID=1860125 RepID=UPI0008057B26|nr:toxic anion resistance protein [Erythrobacter sp. QSSC1-22B]OBX19432.1 toxic anion resistance protein [Erythrobacter sp. QSSC1-22B]
MTEELKSQPAPATARQAPTATATEPAFDLTPPDPVPHVAPEKASGLVPVSEENKSKLQAKVDGFVEDLVASDANSPEFGKKVDQLTNMGRKEIAAAAGMSNRFLDRPVRAMDKDEGVGTDLAELRRVVEDLDPGKRGKLTGPRKILGIIPFGNKLTNYFRSYQSAQTHIQSILSNLANGKDELLMDNAAIDVERQKLWEAMGNLEQMIHISKTLDTKLEEKAAELDATDPAKAKAIRETALFYVRQRTQDLLTQMAVSVQGYLALDLVKKNNVELVKGVDRASTTTVGALRTAVTVAEAMTNQRLVLGQITALNTTTAGIIDSTSTMLRDQTGKIHEQAAASTIPLETLQRAFQNIYDTMDEVDQFKLRALDSMKQTVNVLSDEMEKSKGYIARAEGQAQAQKQVSESNLLSIED